MMYCSYTYISYFIYNASLINKRCPQTQIGALHRLSVSLKKACTFPLFQFAGLVPKNRFILAKSDEPSKPNPYCNFNDTYTYVFVPVCVCVFGYKKRTCQGVSVSL